MATRKAAAAKPAATSADADELKAFCESLEEASAIANGYGELKSAVIEADLSGEVKVTAIYDGRHWAVSFG